MESTIRTPKRLLPKGSHHPSATGKTRAKTKSTANQRTKTKSTAKQVEHSDFPIRKGKVFLVNP
jgi:hypothetical protein